ncbi:MAG: hypothetical protein GF350_13415 [Chitinivibrionales bacterium]|nr:hypothetical protein [Chitinivibrionales bacterium]
MKMVRYLAQSIFCSAVIFVAVAANGFISNYGPKFVWTGSGKAFVPNFVMLGPNDGPKLGDWSDSEYESFLKEMIDEHGFTGVHIPVYGQWFDINNRKVGGDRTPDPATFDKLEMMIKKTYAHGAAVHIWMWGDKERGWAAPNGDASSLHGDEKAVIDMIYTRLNDLPGWTLGYGFDLWEWTSEGHLRAWHDYCHGKKGWKHLLGARSEKNKINQIYDGLDYSGYENHKPDYDMYRRMIKHLGSKPSFSEDRFRIRGRTKDVDPELTRRMLWWATMAGGVAGIWGNLGSETGTSKAYPNKDLILCYNTFWRRNNRFLKDMEVDNSLSDGYCLRQGSSHYVFFKENTSNINISFSGYAKKVIAVDAKKAYTEIDLGTRSAGSHTLSLPSTSDWAIAVGDFANDSSNTGGPGNTDLLSYDFTSMSSPPPQATQDGGSWSSKGWTVKGSNDKLIFDLGREVSSGYAEVVITMSGNPFGPNDKVNYFCISELQENTHYSNGSKAHMRTGNTKYAFSRFKAYPKAFDHTEHEHNIGSTGDWNTDGSTEHVIRLSWDDKGKVTAQCPGGSNSVTYSDFGPIRYIYLGTYNYSTAISGMNFKSLTVKFNDGGSGSSPTKQPPVVEFISPLNGTTFTAPADLGVVVDATDPDGSIQGVKLYINDMFIHEEGDAPYEWGTAHGSRNDAALQNLAAGNYTLKAVATDNDGAITEQVVSIAVLAPGMVVVTDVRAVSGKSYETGVLNTGEKQYIDRDISFSSVPTELAGLHYIRTANDDKNAIDADFLSFTVSEPVTVYVALDDRISPPPSWLNDFTSTGMQLAAGDAAFDVLSKSFDAGTVTLGGNECSGNCSMYTVVIGPNPGPAVPTVRLRASGPRSVNVRRSGVSPRHFAVETPGEHRLIFHSLHGKTVARFEGSRRATYRLPAGLSSGAYIMRLYAGDALVHTQRVAHH